MLTLGVIGGGVLGRAVARGFMEHADVKVYDVIEERGNVRNLSEAATCDIVMICLPTPPLPDGRCDTSYVEDFLRTAYTEEYWHKDSCYVIRSTVPIGFTDRWFSQYMKNRPLFHSPEFLTARCSLADFQLPARNIIGAPPVNMDTWTPEFHVAYKRLFDLYTARFPGVPLFSMQSNASELVKLACNAFFAAKVSMFNLFREVSEAALVDWPTVCDAIMADGRIAHAHTLTPGPDGKPGFGGTCLPKDTASLFHSANKMGVQSAVLLEAILENNDRMRRQSDPELATIDLPGAGCCSANRA